MLLIAAIIYFGGWWLQIPSVVKTDTTVTATVANTEEITILCVGRVHGLTRSGEHVESGRGPWLIQPGTSKEVRIRTSGVDPFVTGWADQMRCHHLQ